MMRPASRLVVLGAAIVAALGIVVGAVLASGPATVDIGIEHSQFSVDRVTVVTGRPVTFVLDNDDPIDHEWIVGTDELHERHRTGTEPIHDARPTEVTVPALSARTTTVTFDAPGTYAFICHLPGHEAYGMVGIVEVRPG